MAGHSRGAGLIIIALTMVFLMLSGTIGAISASEPRIIGRQSRGGDVEPNDNKTTASSISESETVNGTLRMSPADDVADWYTIAGGVPYMKLITATLHLVDYDMAVPWRINFNLSLHWGSSVIQLNGTNQTETIVLRQSYKSDGPLTVNISVRANTSSPSASDPGRYQLGVSITDIPVCDGVSTGYLHPANGPTRAYYKLKGPANDTGMRVRLQCPPTGSYSLSVYNIWPLTGEMWVQNASSKAPSGSLQEACVVGIGGDYYVSMSILGGFGAYCLTTEAYGGQVDNDNWPSNATLISDNGYHTEHISAGVDSVDWWKVDMKQGRTLADAYFTTNVSEGIDVSVYDRDFNYLDTDAMTDIRVAEFHQIVTNYTGPLYFLVWTPDDKTHGWYTLNFWLPNDPPQLNGSIPEVIMDEDTCDDSLVLSAHVWDPDGHNLNYTLLSTGYDTRPKVDRETGRVNFTPRANWSGQEKVRFQVQDDGPEWKTLTFNTTVTINPVNDMPVTISPISNGSMLEEQFWQTPDVALSFFDIDNEPGNLSFGCCVVDSDSHPENALLPVKIGGQNRFTIGPAHLFFGNFTIQVNCTDNHPGTVPASTRFNLTIGHINHDPALNISDPLAVTVKERGTSPGLALDGFFTDQDLPAGYAGDRLSFSISGMKKLNATIGPDNTLVIDTGNEQYRPGYPGFETLTVTAKDTFGRAATLNISVTTEPVNDPPVILSIQPSGDPGAIKEGKKKVFSITASDPDTDSFFLVYIWYQDGVKVTMSKDNTYTFDTNCTMGGSTHRIKVEVYDGDTVISNEWEIQVLDVNRLPDGAIMSPINFTKFARGANVTFTAEALDPDDDNLTFIWRDNVGTELGRGATFTTDKLLKGTHTLTLEINDTKDAITRVVTIIIEEKGTPQKKSPGFETAPFLAVAGICIAIAAIRRNRSQAF